MKKTHYQKYKITSQWGISMTAAQAAEVIIDSLTYKTAAKGIVYVSNCTNNLEGEIAIPSTVTIKGEKYNVTFIGKQAFDGCNSLTQIDIPDSVSSIDKGAFAGCNSLKEIHVSERNTSYQGIDGILFSKDGTLLHTYPVGKSDSSYVIPDSVKTIEPGAFVSCNSLTQIDIPDSVSTIGEGAFYKCASLTSITIPNSVIKIGDFTFRNCTSLKKVYFQSKTPPEVGSSIFSKCPSDMIIYYPAGAEQNWINKWHEFSIAPWNPIK